jgi:deoxycytidine triphosphate deaminase
MSTLGRGDIQARLRDPDPHRRLFLTPLLDEKDQIGRGAVDLRLGTEFLMVQRFRRPGLDPRKEDQRALDDMQERIIVPFGRELWLHPRQFVLAATLE